VDFYNLPNPPNRMMALGSTQPLTEMSTRNFPGGKKRPALRADNLARPCSTNEGEEECIYDFCGKVRRKKTTRKIKT
jgi:hypothetical protein